MLRLKLEADRICLQATITFLSSKLQPSTPATLSWHSRTFLQVLSYVATQIQIQLSDFVLEIFRIVSQKALDNGGESAQAPMGERKVIDVSKDPNPETKKNGCC